jgi:hypothetical protein
MPRKSKKSTPPKAKNNSPIKEVRKHGGCDADTDLIITVTPADIKTATLKDPQHCAAANAIKRELNKKAYVLRSTTWVNLGNDKTPAWTRFQTPVALQREVITFDRGGTFEPGDYKLVPFSPSSRLDFHKTKKNASKAAPRGPTKVRHVTANVRERSH